MPQILETKFMRLKKDESILLVIDIQEKLFPHIHEHDILEKNCRILITGLTSLGVPIMVTEQYSKGLGNTITSIRDAIGTNESIEKNSFSCCGEPDFITAIKQSDKKNVIICGVEAHVCVLQTALDLSDRGYQPVVIEDCVASRKNNDKFIAVDRMRESGVIISTYESILFELCEVAGTEQFKAISRLVK